MRYKTCSTCGNDIPEESVRCCYCNSPQQAGRRPPVRGKYVYTVNLKAGLPSVEEGLARLETELMQAKHEGARLVRIIHGWGSSGAGGKLRESCRRFLGVKVINGQIRAFFPGDDFSPESSFGRNLIKRYPVLKKNERTDRHNRGITFVEL